MSFQDFGSGVGGGRRRNSSTSAPLSSYQNSGLEYQQNCHTINSMLKNYSVLISKIQGLCQSMENGKNLKKTDLAKMHSSSQEANTIANDINKKMTTFSVFYKRGQLSKAEKKNRRQQHRMFLKDSEALQSRFEQVIREALHAEQEYIARVKAHGGYIDSYNVGVEKDMALETDRLIQTQELEDEISFTESMIDERSRGIENIHKELNVVSQTFQDLHQIIMAQRPDIENIEYNIEHAGVQAAGGLKHVREASAYQKSRRKTLMCLLSCCFLTLASIMIYFWLISNSQKKIK